MANSSDLIPIVFILGLSGVGKSKLGEWVEKDLNFLHIEQDSTQGNGIDIWGLRSDWDIYLSHKEPSGLAKTVRERARKEGRNGAILTFDSTVSLSPQEIDTAQNAGILTVILYGTDEDCLNAYLERERQSGRNYDKDRWIKYNAHSYAKFSRPEYAPYRVMVFENHDRKSREHLVELIRHKINT